MLKTSSDVYVLTGINTPSLVDDNENIRLAPSRTPLIRIVFTPIANSVAADVVSVVWLVSIIFSWEGEYYRFKPRVNVLAATSEEADTNLPRDALNTSAGIT
jgi:hypothetical protein